MVKGHYYGPITLSNKTNVPYLTLIITNSAFYNPVARKAKIFTMTREICFHHAALQLKQRLSHDRPSRKHINSAVPGQIRRSMISPSCRSKLERIDYRVATTQQISIWLYRHVNRRTSSRSRYRTTYPKQPSSKNQQSTKVDCSVENSPSAKPSVPAAPSHHCN